MSTASAMGAPAASTGTETQGSQTDSVSTGADTGTEGGGEGEQKLNVTRINPVKPSPNAGLEEFLTKNGGFTVQAEGKTHTFKTVKELERYLQKGIPADKIFQKSEKQRQEMEKMNQVLSQLRQGDAEQKSRILEMILGKDGLEELAISRARQRFEREEEMAKLSPRERQMQEELMTAKQKAAQFEQLRKAIAEKEQQEEHSRIQTQVREIVQNTALKALELLEIPKEQRKTTARAISLMQPIMRQMANAGMNLDPQFVADRVREELTESFSFFTNNLEGEALLKFLGEGVGKKVRNALLAQLTKGSEAQKPAPAATQSTPTLVRQKAAESTQNEQQWPTGRWIKPKR